MNITQRRGYTLFQSIRNADISINIVSMVMVVVIQMKNIGAGALQTT
jgi:hypothetical protein